MCHELRRSIVTHGRTGALPLGGAARAGAGACGDLTSSCCPGSTSRLRRLDSELTLHTYKHVRVLRRSRERVRSQYHVARTEALLEIQVTDIGNGDRLQDTSVNREHGVLRARAQFR
jgi:hypothetical protein